MSTCLFSPNSFDEDCIEMHGSSLHSKCGCCRHIFPISDEILQQHHEGLPARCDRCDESEKLYRKTTAVGLWPAILHYHEFNGHAECLAQHNKEMIDGPSVVIYMGTSVQLDSKQMLLNWNKSDPISIRIDKFPPSSEVLPLFKHHIIADLDTFMRKLMQKMNIPLKVAGRRKKVEEIVATVSSIYEDRTSKQDVQKTAVMLRNIKDIDLF
jgi:NAD-dependent SIR2 family protein deacetylase